MGARMELQLRRVLISLILACLGSLLSYFLFLTPVITAEPPPEISKKLSDEFIFRSKRAKPPPEPDLDKILPSGSEIFVTVTVTSLITGEPSLPDGFWLSQNYPNPFNSSTVIEYALPEAVWVRLEVFNTLGRKVATLVNETQEPGYHSYNWEANNLATGIYFYRISAGQFHKTRKMVLVK